MDFYNCYEATGLFPRLISLIFERTCVHICKPRQTNFSEEQTNSKIVQIVGRPWDRLILILVWLRIGSSIKKFSRQVGINCTFIFREILHILPILCEHIDIIHLFSWEFMELFPFKLGDDSRFCIVHGAVDCTTHRRDRVHPGQWFYYRGDKHYHFIASQVVTSLAGFFCSIYTGFAHNNDQGIYY